MRQQPPITRAEQMRAAEFLKWLAEKHADQARLCDPSLVDMKLYDTALSLACATAGYFIKRLAEGGEFE